MSFHEIDDALNEAINPPEPEAEAEPEAPGMPDVPGADVEQPEGPRYAGKFNTDSDLERGYQEAERAMRQAQEEAAQYRAQIEEFQQAQQQPQEEPFDPWGSLGGGLDENTGQLWVNKLWANPHQAMEDAIRPESVQAFGPQLADQLYLTWLQASPIAAQQWHSKHYAQEQRREVEQLRAEYEADKQRDQEARAEREATTAREQLQQIPDFAQHKDRVVELMNLMPLANDHPMNQSADGVAQYTRMLLGIARDEAFQRAQAENPAQQASAATQAAKARTQQRSTAGAQAQQAAHPDDQAMLDSLAAQIQSGDY